MTNAEFKSVRLKLGLSQSQLARVLEVHPGTVYRWESGRATPPRTAMLLMDAMLAGGGPTLPEKRRAKR